MIISCVGLLLNLFVGVIPSRLQPSECNWSTTKSYYGNQHVLCLRGKQDMASNMVRAFGRWYECDQLEKKIISKIAVKGVLNIGGGIGICAIAAATLGVPVYVVEPNPRSMFYMTASVQLLPKVYRDEMHMFSFALGNVTGFDFISLDDDSFANYQAGPHYVEVKLVEYDHVKLLAERDFDIVQLDVHPKAQEVIIKGARQSILAGRWNFLQTKWNDPDNVLGELGFVRVGEVTPFAIFEVGPIIYLYQWNSSTTNITQ
jgi:hypothetical protein